MTNLARDRRFIKAVANGATKCINATLAGEAKYNLVELENSSRRLLAIVRDFNAACPARPLLPDDHLIALVTARALLLRRMKGGRRA
jgi:hypothetical protein